MAHARRAAKIELRSHRVPQAADEAKVQLDLLAAVDRMMHVPAPTLGALRLKQKLRGTDKGRERWDVAITSDEARLGRRAN